uniref:C2H2-type domain-containing protein n=1 Tax=Mastacembelus armatus TaxID=205130 RepID=A0A3Q3RZF0_9TELE
MSGLLQHIRMEHLIEEVRHLSSEESGKDHVLQKAKTETCTSDRRTRRRTCEYCGKVFKYVSTLNCHIKTHTLPFRCGTCEKKYSSRESLDVHRRIHTGEMPYLCLLCGRGFISSSSHKMHADAQRGKGTTCAQSAGRLFSPSGELGLHMRLHTGEQPYTCRHCGRGFRAKCLLTVHRAIIQERVLIGARCVPNPFTL